MYTIQMLSENQTHFLVKTFSNYCSKMFLNSPDTLSHAQSTEFIFFKFQPENLLTTMASKSEKYTNTDRSDNLAGLSDLEVVGHKTGVHGSS